MSVPSFAFSEKGRPGQQDCQFRLNRRAPCGAFPGAGGPISGAHPEQAAIGEWACDLGAAVLSSPSAASRQLRVRCVARGVQVCPGLQSCLGISIGAHVSTPIATPLILHGIWPGAAKVFLPAGPAANTATLMVFSHVLGQIGHCRLSRLRRSVYSGHEVLTCVSFHTFRIPMNGDGFFPKLPTADLRRAPPTVLLLTLCRFLPPSGRPATFIPRKRPALKPLPGAVRPFPAHDLPPMSRSGPGASMQGCLICRIFLVFCTGPRHAQKRTVR